jgi:hypothetical protein
LTTHYPDRTDERNRQSFIRDLRAIRGSELCGSSRRGLWTQIGRSLDASDRGFASKNKSIQYKDLTAAGTSFGRFGRKFPEHFIEEA